MGFFVGEKAGSKPNRWDQTWFDNTGRPIVVIEHENFGSLTGLESELDHLLYCNSPLRVLITYFGPRNADALRKELVKRIRVRLGNLGSWDFSLLLLTASWGREVAKGKWDEPSSPRDYRASYFHPQWNEMTLSP